MDPRPRSRPALLAGALLVVVVLVLLALLLLAPPANAHALGGVEPSNYQTRVLAVRRGCPAWRSA
jgi:conjugal transfer/entry exclusion protein